ncbi:MAG TPA: glycosyltransferase family 2 protein, partial [Candidatus Avimonas sp.]|nr:glycosyltransferase family 2 protein [Candidatus Avimonas sp.]
MQDIKISVIMPVYKVEKYVGRAIESILAQTLKEFEFLIVDDGSPDNSGKICDEYAAKDSRIRVFHRENGGAPSARNMAMDHAQGKYYYFMDGDDWAEPTMLEDMYELAEKNNAQLVVTGYFIDTYYSDTEYITFNQVQPDAVYDQKSFRENAYKLFDC